MSPEGQRFPDILTAYEHDVATKAARDTPDHRQVVSFLAKFMRDMGSESEEAPRTGDGFRIVRSTSTLDDWLHRGDHPVLKHTSLQVYTMWVYRCETPDGLWRDKARARHLDFDFAPHYALVATHKQRLAPELRVPLFEGFTMPTMNKDCETACLYNQLLLRPLAVATAETLEDERLLKAFVPPHGSPRCSPRQACARVQLFHTRLVVLSGCGRRGGPRRRGPFPRAARVAVDLGDAGGAGGIVRAVPGAGARRGRGDRLTRPRTLP